MLNRNREASPTHRVYPCVSFEAMITDVFNVHQNLTPVRFFTHPEGIDS